jgi:hypothetical protein
MYGFRKKVISKNSAEVAEQDFLLFEQVDSNISLHQLCTYGQIICRAKNLTPVFYAKSQKHKKLNHILDSYFEKYRVIDKPTLSKRKKIWLFTLSFFKWIRLLLQRNLINEMWCGQLIGDVVYDQYLASCRRGTVYYSDMRLAKIIYYVIREVEKAKLELKKASPSAVLLSHKVGLSAAPLAIAAEKNSIPIYSLGGGIFGTLLLSTCRKDYEYTATTGEITELLDLPQNEFDELFESIKKQVFKGDFNSDSRLAFSNKKYTSRAEFSSDFNLDKKKKNVFIMLHAFTDYPHSHFNGMLFKDYLDWFLKTLDFISNQHSVNWIIKQHPSSEFYPVKNLDWDKLYQKYSADNLIFMKYSADFDSRSICHIGDAIVTCVGSAGFEFSALCGIPSITAGDNPYVVGGFAVYPDSIQKYFDVLSSVQTIGKLSDSVLRRARAVFMFIHRLSKVPMHAMINLSHAEHRELQYSQKYFDLLDKNRVKNKEIIRHELITYADIVSQHDFRALRTKPNDY